MTFMEWARDWGIPMAAIQDYNRRMGMEAGPQLRAPDAALGSEARQQALIVLDGASNNVWLTRNNVGVLLDANGRPVRYGLANETKAQNERMKSGDVIGISRKLITPADVGQPRGQFVSREAKHEGWTYTGTPREVAQRRWAEFINSWGGDAGFATGPGSFTK